MQGVNLFFAHPRDYAGLAREPALTPDISGDLRLAVSAAEPLPRRIARAFLERSGHALAQCYVTAEAGVVCAHRWGDEVRPGTVGKPLPGQRLRVLGANLKPMPLEHCGQVHLHGPNVCGGWWKRPEESRAAFGAEGWYRSDDIAWWDEQDCATLFGRAEDVIRSGVYAIQPCEVEEALEELSGIAAAAVLGVPDAALGEAVLALVVRGAPCALGEADIIAAVAAALGPHKAPRQVRFVAELPRDALGRLQRRNLRRQVRSAG
jgi:malonyl-CoA/methylmalonyl-CoA synthetase